MSLKDTFKQLKTLLAEVASDLDKSEGGNKAASQRVRTGTIKLEKVAKLYRKESVKAEKSGSFKKSKSKPSKGKSSSESSSKAKSAKSSSKAKAPSKAPSKASSKSSSKAKASSKASAKPQAKSAQKSGSKASSGKKPTAKIIKKRK